MSQSGQKKLVHDELVSLYLSLKIHKEEKVSEDKVIYII